MLYSKARGSRNSEFIIAEDESDTRVLFLKLLHDESGTRVEMDREKTAEKIREDLNQEKTELKKILNEELGFFKNDSIAVEEMPQKKTEESFTFEFRDEPDSTGVEEKKKEKRRWRRKKPKQDSTQNKPAV